MFLITGASGKTGQAIGRALRQRMIPVRALVRRSEQVAPLRQLGVSDVVVGDMAEPDALAQAMVGCTGLYLICPNMHPDEFGLATRTLAAAQAAGIERVVYHSVLHPQTAAMPHHWQKLRVEEYLFTTRLAWSILQPAAYMQNLLAYWRAIVEAGILPMPYAVTTRLGMVDLEDVAAAAAAVASDERCVGAILELGGPEVLAQTEVAAILAAELGRPVRAECVDRARWAESARGAGMNEYAVTSLLSMFQYYEQYGFFGSPHVLEHLLGRKATRLEEFVQRAKR